MELKSFDCSLYLIYDKLFSLQRKHVFHPLTIMFPSTTPLGNVLEENEVLGACSHYFSSQKKWKDKKINWNLI